MERNKWVKEQIQAWPPLPSPICTKQTPKIQFKWWPLWTSMLPKLPQPNLRLFSTWTASISVSVEGRYHKVYKFQHCNLTTSLSSKVSAQTWFTCHLGGPQIALERCKGADFMSRRRKAFTGQILEVRKSNSLYKVILVLFSYADEAEKKESQVWGQPEQLRK